MDKKILRQDHDFSTSLNYANKKIRDIWMNLVNIYYNSTEDMNKKLQQIKGKTKLNFFKNISNYYKEMKNKNFQSGQDPFARNARGASKIYHEVLLLMTFLQINPQIKNMNINYYDLYYTVIKIRDENRDTNNRYEDDYIDYIDFNDVNRPKNYVGIEDIEY